jgi:putative transposase
LGLQLPPFVALRPPLGRRSNQEIAGQDVCGHHDRPPEAHYECVALPSELLGLDLLFCCAECYITLNRAAPGERYPKDGVSVFRSGGARPQTSLIVAYIDRYKDRFGVEPICRVLTEHDLAVAPSTYYTRSACGLVSQADWDDAHLANRLLDLWTANRRLYGAEKLWTAAIDADIPVGRDQVARLMKILGIEGVRRGKHKTATTVSDPKAPSPTGPDRAGLGRPDPPGSVVGRRLYVSVDTGRVRLRQLRDRRVLPPHPGLESRHLQNHRLGPLRLGPLRLGPLRLGPGAVHPAPSQQPVRLDRARPSQRRGSQYTSITFGEALIEAGISPSIGTVGDALDNALQESTIGLLLRTELIEHERTRAWSGPAEWSGRPPAGCTG